MKISKSGLLVFIYGIGSKFTINFVGSLLISELIALLLLPSIKVRTLQRKFPSLKIILFSLIALLVAQVISDLLNQTSLNKVFRGWAAIIFCMISLIYLTKQIADCKKNIIVFLAATFLAALLFGDGPLSLSILQSDSNYFKVRFVDFLNALILLISYYTYKSGNKVLTILIFIVYSTICMYLDARSNGIIYFISALMLILKLNGMRVNNKLLIPFLIVGVVILYISYAAYVYKVINDDFGGTNAKQQISKSSNPYNPLELIYYGRTDVIVLVAASLDKPIIGHGSWAEDKNGKYALLNAELSENTHIKEDGYIRAHSIIMGYWAYAGILGLGAVILLSLYVIKLFKKIYISKKSPNTLPIIIVFFLFFIWDLLFSPIGHLRTNLPIILALIIVEHDRMQNHE